MTDPAPPPGDDLDDLRQKARSLYAVRRALGWLGLALPILLYAYARVLPVDSRGMQPSISAFYHTHMGDVLVAALAAIGMFLVAYRGYAPKPGEWLSDFWVTTAAGLGALGVALLPAAFAGPPCPPGEAFSVGGADYLCPTQGFVKVAPGLHLAFAILFFAAIAVMCIFLFPKPRGPFDLSTPENRVYAACGAALALACLGLLATQFFAPGWRDWNAVFWFEALGVLAFAWAWLVKGRAAHGLRQFIEGLRPGA